MCADADATPLNRLDSGPLLSYLSRIQNGDRVPFADHLRAAHLLAMHTNEIQDGPKRVQAMLDALEKKIGPEKLSAKDAPVGKYTPGGPDPRDYRIVNPYAGSYILPQNYKQNGQKVAGRVGWEWDGSSGYAVILVPGPPIKMGGEAETDKPQFMFGEEDGLEMPAEWGQKHDFNEDPSTSTVRSLSGNSKYRSPTWGLPWSPSCWWGSMSLPLA
jgi:hypothetical protein